MYVSEVVTYRSLRYIVTTHMLSPSETRINYTREHIPVAILSCFMLQPQTMFLDSKKYVHVSIKFTQYCNVDVHSVVVNEDLF